MILTSFLGLIVMGQAAVGDGGDSVDWKPFVASAGGLKILMPPDPTERVETEKTGAGPVEIHGFQSDREGIVYLATYSPCPAHLSGTEYTKVLDSTVNRWIPEAKRRKVLGERPLRDSSPIHREEDFSLVSREGGIKKIIRRRWMERQGYFYQAIVLMPEARADAPEVARFLASLDTSPIEGDARGLSPAWKVTRSGDHGFSALWPGRLDDGFIHVTKGRKTAGSVTFFVFEKSMGYAISAVQYDAFSPLKPGEKQGKAAEYFDEVRDYFLARYHADLTGERPIESGGLAGREFEAKFAEKTDQSRKHPPGPGVTHVRARLYSSGSHVYMIYVTTSPGQEADKGAATFFDSFRLFGP